MGMILEFPQFAYDILSMVLDQKEKAKDHKGGRAIEREEREGTTLTEMGPPAPRRDQEAAAKGQGPHQLCSRRSYLGPGLESTMA